MKLRKLHGLVSEQFKNISEKKDMCMKDITFCINKECKERKNCFRAEENYQDTNSVNSYAMFDCNSCDERAYLYEKVDTDKKSKEKK